MSSLEGGSVNDGIKEPWCSLSYPTVIDVRSSRDHGLWKGARLIKLDIRNTCRVVPNSLR